MMRFVFVAATAVLSAGIMAGRAYGPVSACRAEGYDRWSVLAVSCRIEDRRDDPIGRIIVAFEEVRSHARP